jgi:hypothetical protein
MFERFRKSHDADDGAVAVSQREAGRDRARTADDRDGPGDLGDPSRVSDARFSPMSAGERDRGVDVDGPHTTSRDGAVHDDTADDERRFDRPGMDTRDERTTGASDAPADTRSAWDDGDPRADDRMRADDPPLSRDRAIEDERFAGAGAGERHREADDHQRSSMGGAAAAGAAAGAAAEHRHDERTMARDRTIDDGRPETALSPGERDRGVVADDRVDDDRAMDRGVATHRHPPILETAAMESMRARQRDVFGGIHWGSDFFGWLSAVGLASLLTAILVGAGVALGLTATDAQDPSAAQTIGLGGGIALLVVLALSWFCGGYVAGRMARFDGARQGLGVWLWTILAAIVVGALAAIGGSQYDVFSRLNLPSIAIGDNTLTTGGAVTGAIALVVTLLFAILGGKAGERYHKKVDRVATDEYVVER